MKSIISVKNITKVFKETKPIGVIHLAAYAYIEESLQNPLLYYENNIIGGINLIHSMVECEIKYLVFSSSCTVYGNSETIPITEYCKPNPMECFIILNKLSPDRGFFGLKAAFSQSA